MDHVGYWSALQMNAYLTSKAKGFHDKDSADPEMAGLQFSRALLLAAGELCEASDDQRDGWPLTDIRHTESGKPLGVPIELADAIIRVADTAEAHHIDLGAAIALKMAYNRTRPHLHGKAF